MNPSSPSSAWQTKPSDRFILKWIKINLSAWITPRLISCRWMKPWMITVCSMLTGMLAGLVYGLGWGVVAGLLAVVSQVLDGVDGQFARLTQSQSDAGAFLDSVLDRYSDGALVIGLSIYNLQSGVLTAPTTIVLAFLALAGSGLISYTSARAEALGIDLGKPTLASKGSRTSVIAVSGLLSPLSSAIPLAAISYLAIHTNSVAFLRIRKAYRQSREDQNRR
jgi:CDP-diacylglycerol--glycerol-3-phosphate 3-phosphatidyltransferase